MTDKVYTQGDYLYIRGDLFITGKDIFPKIFDHYQDTKGEYIITSDPIIKDNLFIFPIRYLNKLIPSDYEEPNVIPQLKLVNYLSPDFKIIGSGVYGKVYKSGNYAIKTFEHLDKYESPYLDSSYLRETATLLRLDHPNIIKLIDIVEGDPGNPTDISKLSIIMPLAEMNLFTYISTRGNKYRDFMAYEILKGFNYLQNKDIIHADIKPDNILIFIDKQFNMSIKISDFGLSNHTSCSPSKLLNLAYSIYFRPLEVTLHLGFGLAADIWAVGCLLYFIYTTKYLFWDASDDIKYGLLLKEDPKVREVLLQNFNKELSLSVLRRMVKILGNPLIEWQQLRNMIADVATQKYDNLPEYMNIFNEGEYHPEVIKQELNNERIYSIIMKMLKYDPHDRVRLNEIVIDEYFKDQLGYRELIEVISCDSIIDRRQRYPSIIPNIDNYLVIRNKRFDYIIEKINRFKMDIMDYFVICFIFDTCYNISIKSDHASIDFTIACISIWNCFKYGEPRGLPSKQEYSSKGIISDQILSLKRIGDYCRMIVNILSNDLTVTTIADYINLGYESLDKQDKLVEYALQSSKKDAWFKYLPKDIFKSIDILYQGEKYIKIINDIFTFND